MPVPGRSILHYLQLLYLVIKMLGNGRNKIFTGKQAPNKLKMLFLEVKMVEERFERRFQTLQTNTQGAAHVFSV